jgi:hypothetical protein
MYSHRDGRFVRTVVESRDDTHAKEVLVAPMGDGPGATLFSAWEAPLDADGQRSGSVTIRRHRLGPDASFEHDTIAELPDRQCRFLLAADFDADGRVEPIATTMNAGLFLLDSEDGERAMLEPEDIGPIDEGVITWHITAAKW